MTSITLDILGLVRARIAAPPAGLATYLRRTMGSHLASASTDATDDLVLQPFPARDRPAILATSQGTVLRFAELEDSAGRGIGTLDRGRLTTAIFPGTPIRLYQDPSAAGVRRVYGLLQHGVALALRRRGAALLHGACLSDGARAIVLFGGRGAGKTRVALGLLRAGWGYVADDKLVLAQGQAHLYEPWIGIRDWHLDACPWLAERLPPDIARRKSRLRRQTRARLRVLGERHLGKRLAAPWAERLNPAANVDVARLFPNAAVLESARLHAAVHLRPATEFAVRPLATEALVRRAADLQRMAVQDWYPVSELLGTVCDERITPPPDVDLARMLAGARCAEVQVASDDAPERIGEALADLQQDRARWTQPARESCSDSNTLERTSRGR
jgi:hypothetical protein